MSNYILIHDQTYLTAHTVETQGPVARSFISDQNVNLASMVSK